MKKSILFVLVAFFANGVHAQDEFITVWDFSLSVPSINFAFESIGPISYTWSSSTGGFGSGTLNNSPAYIYISPLVICPQK